MDTDILNTNLNAYIGLAKLAGGVLGTTTQINAFTCIPTTPASMSVLVTPGEIYKLASVDTDAYGSLAPNSLQILKQGLLLENSSPLSCPAPATVGHSINYLIQITFGEVDGGDQVLPYYNSANPNQAFSGPNNDGLPNYTTRYDNAVVAVKAGTSAPTGTQTTPSPDTGYVAAYVVTVAYGATSITSGNISVSPSAPFITTTTAIAASMATKVGIQNSSYIYAADTGIANVYAIAPSPAYTGYADGQIFKMKAANTNTGACTLNANVLGAKNIKLVDGTDPYPGAIKGGGQYDFRFDNTSNSMQLLNPTISAAFQYGGYGYAADSGSTNAIVVTYTPALTAYSTNTNFYVKVAATNTSTSCTINANSLGTKNIKLVDGSNPYLGAMVAGGIYNFKYDGTNVQLLNPTPSVAEQNNTYTYFVDSGSANAYVITPTPAATSAVGGQEFKVKITNTNVGASVSSVTVNSGGSYTSIPTLTFSSGGVGSGAAALCRMGGLSASIFAAGTGYNVGDTITITGGTFTSAVVLTVATLTGGPGTGVASVTVSTAGSYSVLPSNPVAQGSTSGGGSGATFNLTWKVVSVTVSLGGSGYTSGVNVFPSSVGATFTVNTGYTNTLNVGNGAVAILLENGSVPAPGQIGANMIAEFISNGSNYILKNPLPIPDVITTMTGSSGTYTTPLAALSIYVECVGAGAGGQGNSTNGGVGTAATSGSATTFGSLTANGGSRGNASTNWNSGAGGTATGGDINITGGAGGPGFQNSAANAGQSPGGMGGASYFGGAGAGGNIGAGAGGTAGANTGSGGGGAGVSNTNSYVTGAGGGAGGYCAKLITPTTAQQFSYTVGTHGNGGTGGTANGGDGADGLIIVRARFQ